MSYKIRAIVKRPDEKYGHVTNISNTLKNLQNTVEGHIEVLPLDGDPPRNVIICNEEGKLLGLPVNMKFFSWDVLVGTIAVVGVDGEEFVDCSIDFETWKMTVDAWSSGEEDGNG